MAVRFRSSCNDERMNANELVQPCRICGSPVYEKLVQGELSITGRRPLLDIVRACQNRRCPSNTGELSLADVV